MDLTTKEDRDISCLLQELTPDEIAQIRAIEFPDRVIDMHSHIGPRQAIKPKPEDTKVFEDTVYREVTAIGPHNKLFGDKDITQVVFGFLGDGIDYDKSNVYAQKSASDKNVPFYCLGQPGQSVEDLQSFSQGKFKGFKAHRLTNPKTNRVFGNDGIIADEVLDIANQSGLPIVVHLPMGFSNHLEEIQDVSRRYPNLPLILAHMGCSFVPSERYRTGLSGLVSCPNVYFDTSFVGNYDVFALALQRLGSSRILFATDAPFDGLRVGYKLIDGKLRGYSSDGLPGREKIEGLEPLILTGPRELVRAINDVDANIEDVFYNNARGVLKL